MRNFKEKTRICILAACVIFLCAGNFGVAQFAEVVKVVKVVKGTVLLTTDHAAASSEDVKVVKGTVLLTTDNTAISSVCVKTADITEGDDERQAQLKSCQKNRPFDNFSLTAYAKEKESSEDSVYIVFDANGGKGEMAPVPITASEPASSDADAADIKLPANQFTRYGYVFRGWMTSPNGTDAKYGDRGTVKGLTTEKGITLYALWEPQWYIVRYFGNGEEYGTMQDQYAIYDQPARLDPCMFSHTSRNFAGWRDSMGRSYRNMQSFVNLHSGNTYSRKVLTVDAGKPLNEAYSFRSTQGSVVFEEEGRKYLITAASINDDSYNSGDLSHYETILTKYDLETGEAVKTVRNLPFDHGNGICRSDTNGHIYIAEGGSVEGYPSGVMELDYDLNFVREWNFPLLTHIWAIAYADHHFYMIGRNQSSRNSICVLNDEMQTLSINEVDAYYENFSSQGIAADENFVYAISAGFQSYEWKTKQRINVFTHEGQYLGVWTIDIPDEAEDITILGEYAYISTNEHAKSTLYRMRIPAVNLYAVWK